MTLPDPSVALGAVRDEVATVLSSLAADDVRRASALLADRDRRWFCTGQGRSGLVAQMVAMRLMHDGFDVHAVGEPTAPAIAAGDGLLVFSGSGRTPVTVHLARVARDLGAHVLLVTGDRASDLATLADVVVELPTSESQQFGGTLFEQSSLLLLDALVLGLTVDDPDAHAAMQARHANLQ